MQVASYSFRDLDARTWATLENQAQYLSIFQTYAWARVLKSIGTEPEFLILKDEGEPLLGLLISKSHFLSKILQGYEARGGPLVVPEVDASVLSFFILALKDILKRKQLFYFYWHTPFLLSSEPRLWKNVFLPISSASFVVNLDLSLEHLWKRLEKEARWGVKKAQRMEVTISEATSWEDWIVYQRLYEYEQHQKNVRPRSIALHKSIYSYLLREEKAKLFLARHKQKTIAGGLFLVTPHEMIYYEGTSDPQYSRFEANNAIQWHAMSWAKNKGIRLYDLGGTLWKPEVGSFLYGVHVFKRRWGGELRRSSSLALNRLYVVGRNLFFGSSKIRRLYYTLERLRMIRRFDRL